MMPDGLKKLWVPRADWAAMEPRRNYTAQTPSLIVIHHTYEPSAKDFRGEGTIRGIQRYHMSPPPGGPSDGPWNDIGYHALIAPNGSAIFEGRPWLVQGSHAGGRPARGSKRCFDNKNSIGICCVGNYDEEIPDYRMVLVLQEIIDWLRAEHRIASDLVFGHFQAHRPRPPKTCPGKFLAKAMGRGQEWAKAFPSR